MGVYYGYARISTEGQNDTSLEVQTSFLRKRAEDCEMVFKGVTEKGSGKSIDTRPVFQDLLTKLKPGDIIGVYDNSRFGRNTEDNLRIARELGSRGVILDVGGRFYSPADPSEKLMFSVESSVSTYQREVQNAKAQKGHDLKRMSGDSIFTGKTFGYNLVGRGKNTHAEIDEVGAQTVRFIYDEYIKGRSVLSIFKEIGGKVIPCKEPRKFLNAVNIADILKSPIYMGYYFSENGLKHKENNYTRFELSQKMIKSNKYPPIISEETWWRAFESRRDLSRPRTAPVNFRRNQYECSSTIRCAECGRTIVHATRKYLDTVYNNYTVSLHYGGCSGTKRGLKVEHLDLAMRAIFLITFHGGLEVSSFFADRRELLIDEVRSMMEEKKVVEGEIAKTEKKQKNLLQLVELSGVSDVATKQMMKLNEELQSLKSQLRDIEDSVGTYQGEVEDIAQVESERVIRDYIEGSRRELNLKYIEYGKLYDDRLEVRFFNGKEYTVYFHEKKLRIYTDWAFKVSYKGEEQIEGKINFKKMGVAFKYDKVKKGDTFTQFSNNYWKDVEDSVNECLGLIEGSSIA